MKINFGTHEEWLLYSTLYLVQPSVGTFVYMTPTNKIRLKRQGTVRHLALEVSTTVEKGWCNENASFIDLKCNEIFTKGLPKNLKDFANKRLVNHTSIVLEPSIPFRHS